MMWGSVVTVHANLDDQIAIRELLAKQVCIGWARALRY